MVLRKEELEEEFKKKLQNVPKPINDTTPSLEMKQYLDDLNNGTHNKRSVEEKAEAERKIKERLTMGALFCPDCRRPGLKKRPQGYVCGHCGLPTNTPLRMTPTQR